MDNFFINKILKFYHFVGRISKQKNKQKNKQTQRHFIIFLFLEKKTILIHNNHN